MAAKMIRLRRGSQPCACTPNGVYPDLAASVEVALGAQLLGLAFKGLDIYRGSDKLRFGDMVHTYLVNLIRDTDCNPSAIDAIHHALASTAGVGVAESRMEAAVARAQHLETLTPEEAFRGL